MYVPDGVPVIRGGNLPFDRRFLDEDFVYVSGGKAEELRAHRAVPGDIVITQRGTLGQVGMIPYNSRHPNYIISQSQMKLSVDGSKANPQYVYYCFRAPSVIARFIALASTSGVPHVNLQTLRDFSIPLPPLETQRRIASILGSYDELIEVSRRRVAVLEEMARGLFEEWFVRFRFHGHEAVPIVETSNGPLPEGWTRAPVAEAFSLTRGRSYRSVELAEKGGLPFVNLKCIERDGGFRSTGLKRYVGDYKPMHIVRCGDMVMAVTDMTQERRIVGRTARVPLLDEPEAVISMDLVKVVPAEGVDRAFLYCWLRNSDFGPRAARHANGANVLHLSPKAVADLPICLPPSDLQMEFGRHVEALFSLAEVIGLSEKRLAAARDLLLPRLISGQLSFREAERELEAAA
jgi:type I restriction enzyme S subunit